MKLLKLTICIGDEIQWQTQGTTSEDQVQLWILWMNCMNKVVNWKEKFSRILNEHQFEFLELCIYQNILCILFLSVQTKTITWPQACDWGFEIGFTKICFPKLSLNVNSIFHLWNSTFIITLMCAHGMYTYSNWPMRHVKPDLQ